MVKVKICGITNVRDALMAYEYGADFLGFIFIEDSPRYRPFLKDIISEMPLDIKKKSGIVGLFKNEKIEKIVETVIKCGLTYVQLHGDESPDCCRALKNSLKKETRDLKICLLKVFKVKSKVIPIGSYVMDDYREYVDYFVFDAFHPELSGGTGVRFNAKALLKYPEKIKRPFFVAGGLTPRNVAEVIKSIHPYGVDVSSGVEKIIGEKDKDLLKEFILNAKREKKRA